MGEGYSPLEGGGVQRTDLHCHACDKNFIAAFDFDIEGNHLVLCPHCGHEHFRVIVAGKITEERWSSGYGTTAVPPASVWKSADGKGRTSTAAEFIRASWLNRSDIQL